MGQAQKGRTTIISWTGNKLADVENDLVAVRDCAAEARHGMPFRGRRLSRGLFGFWRRRIAFRIPNRADNADEHDNPENLGTPSEVHHPLLEHDPEKWAPVFGKDHAQTKSQSPALIQPRTIGL